ncbi:MAG: metallophosphoesterase family protein [Gemmatimonadota bacterium]
MRLAVISDIHGNLIALEVILAHIRRHAVDVTVNLGDCVTGPLWPRETWELLSSLGLPTVRGNHDRIVAAFPRSRRTPTIEFTHDSLTDAQLMALGGLPETATPVSSVLAVHGRPASDSDYLLEDQVGGRLRLATGAALARRLRGVTARLVLCGHSHLQHVAMTTRSRLVVNPGSVGCPRGADNDDPFAAEASSPHARYGVATRSRGRWSVELFALDYNYAAVVARARRNGFEKWAAGFSGLRAHSPR